MNEDLVKYIVELVLENAKEANEQAQKEHDDFSAGRKLAYYEIIDSIKTRLDVYGVDLKEYGLDFDISTMM